MDNYDFSILRELRKSRGLTIADVAKTSGISTAVVSRIERNQACPELNTLYRLANLFGMKAADLLGLAEANSPDIASSQHYNSGSFQFQHIKFRNLQCFLGTALAGGSASRPEVHHNEFELCWVLTGSIKMVINNEAHILKEGDAIQFDAVLEHRYHSLEDCKILLVHIQKNPGKA